MKAAIYTRVSSKELQADGYSLDAQEAACRRLAESRDWEVEEVFTDTESARTTDRARFQEMLHQARAGRFDVRQLRFLRASGSAADDGAGGRQRVVDAIRRPESGVWLLALVRRVDGILLRRLTS